MILRSGKFDPLTDRTDVFEDAKLMYMFLPHGLSVFGTLVASAYPCCYCVIVRGGGDGVAVLFCDVGSLRRRETWAT